MGELIIRDGDTLRMVKVSELPLSDSFAGLFTLGVDNENRSVKVSLQEVGEATNNANQAAQTALSVIRHLLPEIDIRLTFGESDGLYNGVQAIVKTPNYDFWEQFKSSLMWGIEYSKRTVRSDRSGREMDVRKFGLMDDRYTLYSDPIITKGQTVPADKRGLVFWTPQQIVPSSLPEGMISDWQTFPYNAQQCMDRLVYFVDTDNTLSDVETALTRTPEEAEAMMRIPGRSKKKSYALTTKAGRAHINFTRRCRLVLFMNVDLVDTTGATRRRRVAKFSREFRVTLCTRHSLVDGMLAPIPHYKFKELSKIDHAF